MKKLLTLTLLASIGLASCSKKSSPAPTPKNVLEYDFEAASSGQFVVNYYDGYSIGSGDNVSSTTWSGNVTIPDTVKSAKIFFSAGQEPPYTNNNSGTVTIKLNGKVVATATGKFTDSHALAMATYNYTAN